MIQAMFIKTWQVFKYAILFTNWRKWYISNIDVKYLFFFCIVSISITLIPKSLELHSYIHMETGQKFLTFFLQWHILGVARNKALFKGHFSRYKPWMSLILHYPNLDTGSTTVKTHPCTSTQHIVLLFCCNSSMLNIHKYIAVTLLSVSSLQSNLIQWPPKTADTWH